MSTPFLQTARRSPSALDGERVISGYDVRDGKVAFVAGTYTTMRELYIGVEGRRVTNLGDAFTSRPRDRRVRALHRPLPDGYEVDAWIVRPPGFDPGSATPRS